MSTKKYISFKNLSGFLDNLKGLFATKEEVNLKSDKTHTHVVSEVSGLQSALDGKAATSHGTHVNFSSTAPLMDGTASVGSASTVARSDHRHPIDTSRASQTSLDSHTSNGTTHITSAERANWNAAYTHSQSTHAPSDAEANQNAFSNVKIGDTTISADIKTDTLTLIAGNNITLTPDASGDSITITSKDTNTTYSAGTGISLSGTTFSNSGVRSISTGGSNGTISVNTNGTSTDVAVKGLGSAAYTASSAYDAAGTAQTKADVALASAKVYTDSVKNDLLNGAGAAYDTLKELGDLIDTNVDAIDALETVAASKANASDLTSHTSNKSNPHGVTLAQLGVTATATELNKMDGITATTAELNIMDGVTATTAEINYLDGVTSSIQTQLDGKSSSSHTHKYAGSSSAGGSATSANKLNTDAGSATQPVYFSNGVPVATTYTLGKSVPSNAVFTDTNTHYASKNVVGATNATSNTSAALSNGAVYINSVENGAVTSSHKISGAGATTVTTDTNGNIIITSTDNNTTYSAAGSSLGLVKSGGDVTISSGVITVNDDSHNHTIANVDNLQASLDTKVPTSRTVNGKALSSDITLSASDVGASASGHTHSYLPLSGGNLTGALGIGNKYELSPAYNYTNGCLIDICSAKGSTMVAIHITGNSYNSSTSPINSLYQFYDYGDGTIMNYSGVNLGLTLGAMTVYRYNNRLYAHIKQTASYQTLSFTIITNKSGLAPTVVNAAAHTSDYTDLVTITPTNISLDGHTHSYAGSSSVGGAATSAIKATQDASGNVITSTYATKTELDTAKSSLQTSINSKANSSHTHTIANITNLQTTLDGKSNTSHTHSYAGSSSVGGSATSAVKLDTSTAGDANTPVYFTGGKPVACTSLDLNTTGSSASCTGNSATATQLQTARTIGLSDGATGTATSFNGTANITIPVTDVKESYLSWGGKSLSGSISPVSAALSTEHSANRIAYLNPNAIKVEYSNDAGSIWADSGLANSAKINLVTTSNGVSVGSNSTVTTSHRTRITLTGQDGTNGYVYTRPRKMLINVSTPHGLTVTVEAKTGVSGASWITLGTYTLTGWSGWNDIPMGISTFGGGTNQTSNYWYIRLTFANTSVNSSYTTTKSSIIGLRLFGDTCWTRTSNMGETGHLYSYDSSQNATFPANVTATTFVGALSGNATTATTATKLGSSTVGGATQPVYINNGTATACTYTLGKSVPSNAVFTDTDTKVTNTLATTTKAYVTGTTSASTNTGTQVFDTGVYLDTTAGQLTATTFNGTTFSGSGVATLAEVKSYLGI